MKTNFKLLALTAAVGAALSGVAVAENVDKATYTAEVGNINTRISDLKGEADEKFKATGGVLKGLADKSKQNEEDIAELQDAMDELENAANENTVAIDDLKEYVDGYIGTVIDDYDGVINDIDEDLKGLGARMNTLDPNKVSEMVGAADSRLATAEDDIVTLRSDLEDKEELIVETAALAETNAAVITRNAVDIGKNKADIEKNKADIVELQDDVTTLRSDLEDKEELIVETAARVETNAAVITRNAVDIGRNQADIAQNRLDIAHNSARIDKLNKDLKRGLATQAALSGLFQPYSVGKFNVTAAVGGYKSEVALAVGTGYRFNEKLATKAGVAFNKGGVSYNVGVNYEF